MTEYEAFAEKLSSQYPPNMFHIWDFGDGTYIAVRPFIFTSAIVRGVIGDYDEISDRWCYHSTIEAVLAAQNWLSDRSLPEPEGWHRHPMTGRRRPDGDPSQEYVRF